MGLFEGWKEWGQNSNNFYVNPYSTKDRPSCNDLARKLETIHSWLLNNASISNNVRNSTFSTIQKSMTVGGMLENSYIEKYGDKKYTIPKHKLDELKQLCDNFQNIAMLTKVEIETIPLRAAAETLHYRDEPAIYKRIAQDLAIEYSQIVNEFKFLTDNIYTRG